MTCGYPLRIDSKHFLALVADSMVFVLMTSGESVLFGLKVMPMM